MRRFPSRRYAPRGAFVLAMGAVLGLAVANSPLAAAGEHATCIQLELQERGYDVGSVDGELTPQTIVAADRFAEAALHPMPALAEADAAEWCHLLRSWDDLTAAHLDSQPFANTDPGALPLGIWFDSPVPISARQLILDDLLWLANLGELEASADIAAFLGLGSATTGTELVAWLLLHARAMSVTPVCFGSPTVLFVELSNSATPTRSVGIDVPYRCDGVSQNYWGFVEYNPYSPRPIARIYDGHTVYTSERAFPVIHLGNRFIQQRGRAFIDRVGRLLTLFHEAHHIADGSNHVTCSRLNLLSRTNEFGRRGTLLNGVGHNCDIGVRSAYFLDGIMAELLLANCVRCGEDEADGIRDIAVRAYMRVQLPLSSTQRIVNGGLFAGRNVPEVPIRFIPPERFFALRASEYIDEVGRVPPWFAELQGIAEQLAWTGRYVDEPWVTRPAVPSSASTDLAMAWLLRASRSRSEGYNVPLGHAPPCEQTPIGCRENWWDQIEILENGVAAPFALGSGAEVKLARIEFVGPDTGRLHLSLQGNGHGSLLYMCHLESESCIRRVVGAGGEIIRWPDATTGTYGVWIDGFGTDAAIPEAPALSLLATW